jgi:hypothetical protein
LELGDPEVKILGIDAFQRINRFNLVVIALLYKAKIALTNLALKLLIFYLWGGDVTVGGTPLASFLSVFVEVFWNCLIIIRVVNDARLRLFGYFMSQRIAKTAAKHFLCHMTNQGQKNALRAVGNCIVLTKNYHPNNLILLLEFAKTIRLDPEDEEERFDDWKFFVMTLGQLKTEERYFCLDLLCVAAAFDGYISRLEKTKLKEAFGQDVTVYEPRMYQLTSHLERGRLYAALELSKLDFQRG